LEEARRAFSKMQPEIFRYKAELIKRTEFPAEGKIAIVTVPQDELDMYSPLYNPAPLIQADMLQTEGVMVAIVLKSYKNGKTTGAIRTNVGGAIADKLAVHFGGGGHAYASGFKIEDGKSLDEIKTECLKIAKELLDAPA
jgi:phosphoesterase RecJ-like protein